MDDLQADLPALLGALAERHEAHVDESAARRTLDELRRELPNASAFGLLGHAAERFGLRLYRTSTTVNGLCAEPGLVPAVVIARTRPARWAFVREALPGRLAVRRTLEHADWVEPPALAGELGVGVDEAVDLLLVEPEPAALHAARPEARSAPHGSEDHGPAPRQRLLQWVRAESGDVAAIAIYAAAIGLLSLSVPLAVQALVNNVVYGRLLQPIVALTAVLFGVLCITGLLRSLQSWAVELLQQRLFVRSSIELAHRLAAATRHAFDGAHPPEQVNRFFDVLTIQKSAASLLLDGLALALQMAIGSVLLAFYHPLMLAFSLLVVACVAFILWVLGRSGAKTSIEESYAKYAMAAWLQELAAHETTFRAEGAATQALERTDALARTWLDRRRSHFRVVFRQAIASYALHAIASALLLGLGGLLVMRGQLSLGALVAAELVASAVLAGVSKLGKHLETYYDLIAAVDKLGHLLDMETERAGGHELPPADAKGSAIAMHEVSFGHDPAAPLLERASFRVEPGERVSIEGLPGAGRSTLFELLFGRLCPSSGSIEVDGVDLRLARLEALRERVAYVRGDELFAGTIEDNVRVGRPGVGPAEVRHALAAVGLREEVLQLPDGIATRITTRGAPLSESQRARLVLARAIAARPRLLLVDGSFDGLDGLTLEKSLRAVLGPDAPWTVIVATRSKAVARACQRRVRLHEGRLVETAGGATS